MTFYMEEVPGLVISTEVKVMTRLLGVQQRPAFLTQAQTWQ